VVNIYNFIRGLSPYPAAYTELEKNGERIAVKIFRAGIQHGMHNYATGKIIIENRRKILVAVRGGYICPLSLQLAGKNRMDSTSFINGFSNLSDYSFI
jgi:methionyl-tRNA formyltransferase